MHAIFTGHELSDKVIKFETDRGRNICEYRLTATQKDEADRRLQEIHGPVGFGWSPKPMFRKVPYVKCHDYYIVCDSRLRVFLNL